MSGMKECHDDYILLFGVRLLWCAVGVPGCTIADDLKKLVVLLSFTGSVLPLLGLVLDRKRKDTRSSIPTDPQSLGVW
jgi:hypothetical protein